MLGQDQVFPKMICLSLKDTPIFPQCPGDRAKRAQLEFEILKMTLKSATAASFWRGLPAPWSFSLVLDFFIQKPNQKANFESKNSHTSRYLFYEYLLCTFNICYSIFVGYHSKL